ncbi:MULTISPECIES: hypothetical protein [Paenibacillus]|uniref:hypothetical protein n=1 Tax=Paenibacillus TaxID=44249 RepID=UPI0003F7EF26|nr:MULTISPECIES: hypothetical protein [Paenibacillus]MDN4078193.1 hypothetical protein [Paenibacillus polymyxa]MDN4103614.1 hypothetical protein [Paenibacillus polymyxa]MDN4113753.1 hypothetical protein [Paenibacillus polymyxa]UMY55359.1 hypothetical protein MLD56_02555 [Paenibacillus peoriae]
MNHRFKTPLAVYRVGQKRDDEDLFDDRKSGKITDVKCFVVKTQTEAKADSKPVIYIVKKTVGVPLVTDIKLSDEVVLLGRRYLVIDSIPRRYWRELLVTYEVKGNDRA